MFVFTLCCWLRQFRIYISFRGQTLANHSYVDLSRVGDDTSDSDSVQFVTDLNTCCTGAQGPHRGDWYFPNGTRLPFTGDIHESRRAQRVDLRRIKNGIDGIYRCDISTDVVHDTSVRDTMYVGLYLNGGGECLQFQPPPIVACLLTFIVGNLSITKIIERFPEMDGCTSQLILTCNSTGGPATTVTWTRDSTPVAEETKTVLNDPVTAQYTHTLTVNGSLGRNYTCTVANNKHSNSSSNFTVNGK